MHRFRKILVWIEDSEAGTQALRQAATVARQSGAALTLAYCLRPTPRLLQAIYARVDELNGALRSEWERKLEEMADGLRNDGIDATSLLLEGRPFIAFAQQVQRGGHDLLVKPAEETSQGVRLGSNDMHVLRKCPCAVWITGADEPKDDAVLTLVDPDPDNDRLNERLLQVGTSLAAQRGADLCVAHVWEAAGVGLLERRARADEVAAYIEDAKNRARTDLDGLLDRFDLELPADRVLLPRGSVQEVVPRLGAELGIGIFVMGTVSRTGISGLLIGNTAETILARVNRPVLTIKPDGFVSPVTLSAS
jgi:nucleotide-binding universal stress UspA family protein